ncbi:MAG: GntR family transcriptional regulator [Isosphaeraceae bacterium]
MPVPPREKSLRCDHGLRRQAIVESLLRDVVHGRLRPGQHLVTQTLAGRFGVSHTPIREAMIALAGMGIVDLLPNRGAVVCKVTSRDIREICEVRRTLECEATRLACGRIDLEVLRGLQTELTRLVAAEPSSGPRFVEEARDVDGRLHDAIAGACGNGFLAKELGRLKVLFRGLRDVAWEREEERNDYHRLALEAREHLAIVDGLLVGDRRQAAHAMAKHIRSGSRYWSKSLPEAKAASNGQTDPDGPGKGDAR